MTKYSKYIDENVAFDELVDVLKKGLERDLTELEMRKMKWFSDCDYETIGVFIDLLKELVQGTSKKYVIRGVNGTKFLSCEIGKEDTEETYETREQAEKMIKQYQLSWKEELKVVDLEDDKQN